MEGRTEKQVRDDVKALVVAAATPAGSRVYIDRVAPLADEHLPAVLIYDVSTSDQSNGHHRNPHFTRTMALSVQYVAGVADDDALATATDVGVSILNSILNDVAFMRTIDVVESIEKANVIGEINNQRRVGVMIDLRIRFPVAWNQC